MIQAIDIIWRKLILMHMWGYLYLGNFQLQTFAKGRNLIKNLVVICTLKGEE